MEKILPISLQLNFTPNTLGSYGLKQAFNENLFVSFSRNRRSVLFSCLMQISLGIETFYLQSLGNQATLSRLTIRLTVSKAKHNPLKSTPFDGWLHSRLGQQKRSSNEIIARLFRRVSFVETFAAEILMREC